MTFRRIQKSKGGSFSIVIPPIYLEQCGLKGGMKASIEQVDDGILIKKNTFDDIEGGLRKGAEQIRKEMRGRK